MINALVVDNWLMQDWTLIPAPSSVRGQMDWTLIQAPANVKEQMNPNA